MTAPVPLTHSAPAARRPSRLRRTFNAALLVTGLAALAAAVAVPWNASAFTAPSPAQASTVVAPPAAARVPAPDIMPDTPLMTDNLVDEDVVEPGARRSPNQIAASLERKLLALKAARERGNQRQVEALKRDLLDEDVLARSEMDGQLRRGTTPVYWAVTLIREAVAYDDDAAMDRALRYLRAMTGR